MRVNQVRRLRPGGWLAWNEEHVVTGNTKEEALKRLDAADTADTSNDRAVRLDPVETGDGWIARDGPNGTRKR
jgi:hypothetical protein